MVVGQGMEGLEPTITGDSCLASWTLGIDDIWSPDRKKNRVTIFFSQFVDPTFEIWKVKFKNQNP